MPGPKKNSENKCAVCGTVISGMHIGIHKKDITPRPLRGVRWKTIPYCRNNPECKKQSKTI